MRVSLPAVLAFLCGFAATVVVVQHRVPALGALHLDGTHSPHHLRAKPADFAPAAAAAPPRSGLLDKLRAELPAAMRATPPPTGAAPSAQERREAERLEAERRADAEVAAAREAVAREALARPSRRRHRPPRHRARSRSSSGTRSKSGNLRRRPPRRQASTIKSPSSCATTSRRSPKSSTGPIP